MAEQERNFLIVDDEPYMCWVLNHLLEQQGFGSEQALNANEALTKMACGRFQSIFLDAKLPDIEGLELAPLLRNIDPQVRIIMISGYFYPTDDAVIRASEAGLIDGFISKPFDHSEVLGAIRPPVKERIREFSCILPKTSGNYGSLS